MQTFQRLFNLLVKDIRVELNDEFDRNFERKAFFNTSWKPAARNIGGSLLIRTGALRSSLRSDIIGNSIRWESSLPYANIHNSGGTIVITQKMKGFFWYRYRMATGGDNKNLNPEAQFFKAMALKRVGSVIIMPQRQFIGSHPMVDQAVKDVTDEWFANDLKPFIDGQLNNVIK